MTTPLNEGTVPAAVPADAQAVNDDQLRQLCAALGWQGGTFWQVLDEVKRLRHLQPHLSELLKCMERFTDEMTVGERYSNAGQAALDSLPVLRALATSAPPPVEAREPFGLVRSIIHECPALKMPQTWAQKLGMMAQIVPLKGLTQEQAQALVDRLNAASATHPKEPPAGEAREPSMAFCPACFVEVTPEQADLPIREARAYKWAYEYLQSRMESIGRHGWEHDCDGEIEARIAATHPKEPTEARGDGVPLFDRAAVLTIWQGMQYQGGINSAALATLFAQQVLAAHGLGEVPTYGVPGREGEAREASAEGGQGNAGGEQ